MKKWCAVFALLLLSACTIPVDGNIDGRLNVVVSFYPLEEFAKAVGGDKVSVFSLVKPGVEPHDWEPSPSDIVKISNADILVFNGAGLEGWLDKTLRIKHNDAVVVVASDGIELLQESGNVPVIDPHVWLNPVFVKKMIENIANAFVSLEPANAEFYHANAEKYVSRLNVLDDKFRTWLSNCARREFVVSHDAFGYLAQRYSLVQLPVSGISPEVEPTPGSVVKLLKLMKDKNIDVFFVEPLVNPKMIVALAGDAGARVEMLNPFEGLAADEIASGQNYFSIMEQNLNKLISALGCVQ